MNATPASVERVQKYVFNFEIYCLVKKRPIYPYPPLYRHAILRNHLLRKELAIITYIPTYTG